MADVQPYQVDAVVNLVREMNPDHSAQLTLLTASLVILARNYGITRSHLADHVNVMFGRPAEVKAKGVPITGQNDNADDPPQVSA